MLLPGESPPLRGSGMHCNATDLSTEAISRHQISRALRPLPATHAMDYAGRRHA